MEASCFRAWGLFLRSLKRMLGVTFEVPKTKNAKKSLDNVAIYDIIIS